MTDIQPERGSLQTEAIAVLTRAAQQTTDSPSGLDFADFIARVLAATAANVGGPDRLLSARPGSWEASLIEALLRGTVGEEPSDWHRCRTEPLIVPLNVAELVEDGDLHPGLLGLDDVVEALDLRYLEAGTREDDATLDAWAAEVDALSEHYETEYRAYADRFAIAAQTLGTAMTPPVEVRVVADTRPTPRWWDNTAAANPTQHDSDPLALALWHLAHDTVALPNVNTRSTHWDYEKA